MKNTSYLKNMICHHYTAYIIGHISDNKSYLSSPLFAQFQTMKMSDFTSDILRQWVDIKISRKFLECAHTFALSWKHNLHE